jgi:transcriptional regulator with XRE-family HTH domain
MARRKNLPETVRTKCHLAERLREIRTELFGERGGSEMARRLGVPIRTWYNYESGVTVPAEVLLRFLELTSVEPLWLLHGRGEKFRTGLPSSFEGSPSMTVEALLRTALQHLERRGSATPGNHAADHSLVRAGSSRADAGHPVDAQRAWLDAERQGRCVQVEGDAMVPIVADGARVAFSGDEETPEELDGALVVAWIEDTPLVRWFRLSGAYGLLRAENPESSPNLHLIDLAGPPETRRVRRVLWISTPH